MTPVAYLEHRVRVLRAERPVTLNGVIARDAAIQELNRCIIQLRIQTLDELRDALREQDITDAIHRSPLTERI